MSGWVVLPHECDDKDLCHVRSIVKIYLHYPRKMNPVAPLTARSDDHLKVILMVPFGVGVVELRIIDSPLLAVGEGDGYTSRLYARK